jgi:hypothetical protein
MENKTPLQKIFDAVASGRYGKDELLWIIMDFITEEREHESISDIAAVVRSTDNENDILRAENARLKDEFFRMQGENMALNMTIDELRGKNAEPA